MDITMCMGNGCPLKENCLRYKSIPNEDYQSYFTEIPYKLKENKCEFYWPIKLK